MLNCWCRCWILDSIGPNTLYYCATHPFHALIISHQTIKILWFTSTWFCMRSAPLDFLVKISNNSSVAAYPSNWRYQELKREFLSRFCSNKTLYSLGRLFKLGDSGLDTHFKTYKKYNFINYFNFFSFV